MSTPNSPDHKDGHGHSGHGPSDGGHGHHYILPDSLAHKTFGSLLVLTAITVGLSYVNLGSMNYVVGMIVAFTKATLVVAIFMNLRKDDSANTVIFLSSILFLAIFIVLTSSDILFRGNVYTTKGAPLFKPIAGGASRFQKAWEPSPELVAHGKEIYSQQCVACHGDAGAGNGPAAAALNPRPRNFVAGPDNEWKNGRKPSQIFKTLKEGIAGGGMASYVTLPADDRWGLSHYVASLGPNILKDELADLTNIGIDPNNAVAVTDAAKTIPVDVAMKQLVKEAGLENSDQNVDTAANAGLERYNKRLNARSLSNK